MNTIKFQFYTDEDPLVVNISKTTKRKDAKVTTLYKGYEIWHRPYVVRSAKEFTDWQEKHWINSSNCTLHYVNRDPHKSFEDHGDFECYFHILTFWEGEKFHKFLVFCAECFIMNEAGQTIDSFNA